MHPGAKKVVPIAPGAGRRLEKRDIIATQLVCVDNVADSSRDNPCVEVAVDRAKLPLLVLHHFGSTEFVQSGFFKWQHSGGLVHTIRNLALPEPQLSNLVTSLVRASSFSSRPSSSWSVVDESDTAFRVKWYRRLGSVLGHAFPVVMFAFDIFQSR